MSSDSIKPQRIQRWLTTVTCGPGAPPRMLRLALYYVTVDEAQRLLRVWELEGVPEANGFRELVVEIDLEASEDAAQLAFSTQRYVLRAHFVGGQDVGSLSLRYAAPKLEISPWVNMFAEPVPSISPRPRRGMAQIRAKGLTGQSCLDPAAAINTLRIRRQRFAVEVTLA